MSSDRNSSEWIAKKVKPLTDSKDMCAVSNIHYAGHHWSIVKLILLGGWVYVYTTIIPKWFPNYRYVDLLAGSGTTYVKETKDVVIGSAFVARDFARNPFKSYVFIEKNMERCEALGQRARARFSEGEFRILRGDCNEHARSVFSEESVHSLVFIDNEGFDVSWNTTEVVLKAQTDVLINFPTSMVSRTADNRTASSLNQFYGDHSWSSAQNREGMFRIYLQKLRNRFKELGGKEAYVSSIRVGTGSYFYDIVLVCKKAPFVNAWEYLKKKLDWQNPRVIQTTLDILMNRAMRMDAFIEDLEKKVTSIKQKSQKNEGDQPLEKFM